MKRFKNIKKMIIHPSSRILLQNKTCKENRKNDTLLLEDFDFKDETQLQIEELEIKKSQCNRYLPNSFEVLVFEFFISK